MTEKQLHTYSFRLPHGLVLALKRAAAGSSPPSSLNREVVQRLMDSFRLKGEARTIEELAKVITQFDFDLRELKRENKELRAMIESIDEVKKCG
jgi:hypothetical protein